MLWRDILLISFTMYMCENHWRSREKILKIGQDTAHSGKMFIFFPLYSSFIIYKQIINGSGRSNTLWHSISAYHGLDCGICHIRVFWNMFFLPAPAHLSYTQVLQPLNMFLYHFLQIVTVYFSMDKQYSFWVDSHIHKVSEVQ